MKVPSLPCSANCVHWVQTSITDCVWPLKITGCTWDVLSHFQKPLWALFLFNKPSYSTFQQKLTGNPRVIYIYVKKQIFFIFSFWEYNYQNIWRVLKVRIILLTKIELKKRIGKKKTGFISAYLKTMCALFSSSCMHSVVNPVAKQDV